MKSIFTSIIALFLLPNLVYGSQNLDNESNIQEIRIYKESPWHTPKEWKKIPSLDYPWITAEEEEIAAQRAMRRFDKVGAWRPLHDHITFTDDYNSSGFTTPEGDERSSQQLMDKAQHCLKSLMFRIDENFNRQKLFIHSPGNELYLDCITKNELQDRVMLHENICGTKRWIGDSDSEDEAPTSKRQRTKSSSNL